MSEQSEAARMNGTCPSACSFSEIELRKIATMEPYMLEHFLQVHSHFDVGAIGMALRYARECARAALKENVGSEARP